MPKLIPYSVDHALAGAVHQVPMLGEYDPGGTAGDLLVDSLRSLGDVEAYWTSDRRLKESVEILDDALEKINTLHGFTFVWSDDAPKFLVGPSVGLFAQEVRAVLPEAVRTRVDGYLALRYELIVPLLVQGIKELLKRVEKLEESQ